MKPARFIPWFLWACICLFLTPINAMDAYSVYNEDILSSIKTENPISFTLENDKQPPYRVKKVVIDAGHGGVDPGAVGAKTTEAKIVLELALKVGNKIKAMHPDVEVIYTREKDVFVPLHERASIANKAHADLFISIHCNAAANKKVSGTETFVLGLHRAKDNLNVAKRENESIFFEEDYKENYAGYDPNSPEGHILLSFFQNAFLNQSITLASKIEQNFVSGKRHSRGVKQDGFLVLRHATMPAVLVEAGFISNVEEEAFLMSAKGQDIIANGIAKAFSDYKQLSEATRGALPDVIIEPSLSDENSALEIEFCVQFMSNPQSNADVKQVKQLGEVKVRKEGPTYKYQLAGLSNYEAALEKRKMVQSKGYKDAFIVAYHNGQKIGVQEAISLLTSLAETPSHEK